MGLLRNEPVVPEERTIVSDGLVVDDSVTRPGYTRLALRVTDRGVDYWVVCTLEPGETEELARGLAGVLGMRLQPLM